MNGGPREWPSAARTLWERRDVSVGTAFRVTGRGPVAVAAVADV